MPNTCWNIILCQDCITSWNVRPESTFDISGAPNNNESRCFGSKVILIQFSYLHISSLKKYLHLDTDQNMEMDYMLVVEYGVNQKKVLISYIHIYIYF